MSLPAKYLILPVFFFMAGRPVSAQSFFVSDTIVQNRLCKPPLARVLFHETIDALQKKVLNSDGRNDSQFTPSPAEEINFLVTRALVKNIDELQCKIELDSSLNEQGKVRYLRGIESLLKYFITNTMRRKLSPLLLPDIIINYEHCVENDIAGLTIEDIISSLPYETAYTIINADQVTFERNPGYKASQQALVLKYCILHPDQVFLTLQQNPDLPFADSLIRTVAKKYPGQLYDYAAADNKLGFLIRSITGDSFISKVVRMATSKSGQQYFPFIDIIVNGKMTFEEIDSVKNDPFLYYRLMVKTQMDYTRRAMNKDTAFGLNALTEKLEKRVLESFINVINDLHTEPSEVRFRIIQSLTAEELYYLAVMSDGAIYTSSFVKGVYPLMMKKIRNKGDSLLVSVHFDKYRKFIKMAAGYNVLSNFLSSFSNAGDADNLMKAFVGNLEKTGGLEDGVDVADSYASVVETLRPLADEMLKNIRNNYQRNLSGGNKEGMILYNILYKLCLSADSANPVDLTKELGIPPVYKVPFKALVNDSGRVILQLFIYGDKDGIGVFPGLISMFRNANWKIDGSNKQWVAISSAKGSPVTLYMNRPMPEENNEDAEAQKALCAYLKENDLYPTVTINRGHSYNAPFTIEQMSVDSKIVFMGSCGGFRMINDILIKAPDAHIIGTKQIADAPVNNPFLKLIMEKLRQGRDIDWIPFWKELSKMITDKIFDDYVPPHKNLGAIFIKAYNIAFEL